MLLRASLALLFSFSLSLPLTHASEQLPMNPILGDSSPEQPFSAGDPTLYDLLTIERRATIFADYVRGLRDMTGLLSDRAKATTVLVPTNKAVLALARKPHQGPPPKTDSTPGNVEISDEQQDKASEDNVRNWVSSHMIPAHPISLSSDEEFPTLHEGTNIHFTAAKSSTSGEWEHYVLYPDVKIITKLDAVNGAIYLIEGTVSYYD